MKNTNVVFLTDQKRWLRKSYMFNQMKGRCVVDNYDGKLRNRISVGMLKDMRGKGFSPNRFITLLGYKNSSLDAVRDAYIHTINVLQRKVFGRYGKKIKHLATAEYETGKGAHIHALIDLDTDRLSLDEWRRMIKDIWSNTRTGTSLGLPDDIAISNETWFENVTDIEGVVGYCFKNSTIAEKYQFVINRY